MRRKVRECSLCGTKKKVKDRKDFQSFLCGKCNRKLIREYKELCCDKQI
jgi:hypothetical protein